MSIERFHVGPRMSQVVVHNGTVYTAGQVAQNAGGGTVTAQTEDILAAIDGLLADAGSDKSRLLSATIWLNSMDDFAEMNAVWDAWVAPGRHRCGLASNLRVWRHRNTRWRSWWSRRQPKPALILYF